MARNISIEERFIISITYFGTNLWLNKYSYCFFVDIQMKKSKLNYKKKRKKNKK